MTGPCAATDVVQAARVQSTRPVRGSSSGGVAPSAPPNFHPARGIARLACPGERAKVRAFRCWLDGASATADAWGHRTLCGGGGAVCLVAHGGAAMILMLIGGCASAARVCKMVAGRSAAAARSGHAARLRELRATQNGQSLLRRSAHNLISSGGDLDPRRSPADRTSRIRVCNQIPLAIFRHSCCANCNPGTYLVQLRGGMHAVLPVRQASGEMETCRRSSTRAHQMPGRRQFAETSERRQLSIPIQGFFERSPKRREV